MKRSTQAWLGLGSGIILYDYFCPEGQTLSEGVDIALEKHPFLTVLAIGTVALHLCNVLPQRIDPLHQLARLRPSSAVSLATPYA
jgi:hypothetical protein